jgi:hypothetical protein
MTNKKIFVSANELLIDSFILAKTIYEDGFIPDIVVGIWRGGTPVAIAVSEFFKYVGCDHYHTAIKAESYHGFESKKLEISGLGEVEEKIKRDKIDKVLLVDDVFDTGKTMAGIKAALLDAHKEITIKIATVYYKPAKNETDIEPDYYLHETDMWIVFPHELEGLTKKEIREKSPELYEILNRKKVER